MRANPKVLHGEIRTDYRFNPAELLGPEDHEMIALWRLRRGGGGGIGLVL
jgi:hypothetical protein